MKLNTGRSNSTLSPSTSTNTRPRFLVVKGVRRFLRTLGTKLRRVTSRPEGRKALILVCLLVSFLSILFFVLFPLFNSLPSWRMFREREPRREESHFSHKVHTFLPRTADFDTVANRPCSWLYLEFGAKDGRHLAGFFDNGNGFLEEYLRATQSAVRAFCAIAFDPNPDMLVSLMQTRKIRAQKAAHFNVFTQYVPGSNNDTEQVRMKSVEDQSSEDTVNVRNIPLAQFIKQVTFPWDRAGQDIRAMTTAIGNGNKGNVIVRFNINDLREAYMHLDQLESKSAQGVMCQRIDRLILNFNKMRQDPNKVSGDIVDSDPIRDWELMAHIPSSEEFNPENGFEKLLELANQVNDLPGCRTTVHVFNNQGKMIVPKILSEKEVFYAILAGQPTFDERIAAQTESWMTAVPNDRLTIFTNIARNEDELKAAKGRETVVVQPHRPELEKTLSMMQSWSHLVRLRESWDRAMKDNPEIKWLALVDDDTFVFPGGLREYLSKFDSRVPFWGGSGEQARIDNGDSGKFANWLRNTSKAHGAKHCYFENEEVPKSLQGSKVEYGRSDVLNGQKVARKVSHMCSDTFCRKGCPAVPQGAAIMVSRALVEAVRPHVEECEKDTAGLCKSCGSQRLYMCVNRYTKEARTLLTRGICRAPWKLEHRESFPFALTFHGFNRYRGRFSSTKSLHGDMRELWQLGKTVEERARIGLEDSYLVSMQAVANMIGCHGQGKYIKGRCASDDGIETDAIDGKHALHEQLPGHRALDRKGSA